MISMTPRKHISVSRTLVTPLIAIVLTLLVGATIFGVLGFDPLGSLYEFFVAPISRPDQVGDLFVKACPLIITATGLVFCYRANVWNIGAEGQLIFGAGLAGMVEVSASMGQLQPNVSFGYGFTAIIVAFLARLNPIGVIFAGLIVALAELGGDNAQIVLGMPKVVTGVFKGILLFMLLAGETFNRYKVEWRRREYQVAMKD